MYAFDSPLQRGAILADEVGLGKTIEAGIVVSQLWAEGKRKILIICPASIRKQWQDELSLHFGLNSEVIDGPIFETKVNSGGQIPLTYDGIFIVSLQFAYQRKGLIEKQSWRCVVIDEAHRLRNVYKGRDASKMAWEIRNVMQDKPKLLLTATPLQNNLMELYGIATFIDDKILGTPYSFKKRFVEPLAEKGEFSKVKLKELRQLVKGEEQLGDNKASGILTRTLRNQVIDYVKFTRRKAFTQDFTPTNEEIELYEKVSVFNAEKGRVEELERIYKTEGEWRSLLTPEQYSVTRLKGTERPFSGTCAVPAGEGEYVYRCVGCGTDLFRSGAKFQSGTGWPSFAEPVSELNITTIEDRSHGMVRTEVLCALCGAHLGHVFDDGPLPSGNRHCINSVAIKLVDAGSFKRLEKAAFAAGCFWGVEASLRGVKGVVYTAVGFMGGTLKNPTYEQVCRRDTGNAETVFLEYNPDEVSYEQLLNVFWKIHNPTTPDRQGPDVGTQYRSVIFYYNDAQEKAAKLSAKELERAGRFNDPVVTRIVPAQVFYRAEEYHQRYYEKQGRKPACIIPE